MVCMQDKAEGLVACREMPEHFSSARWYTDDTRSHFHPCAQFWLGSFRNWSVFLGSLNTGSMRRLRFVVHALRTLRTYIYVYNQINKK